MEILIATSNPGKVREIEEALRGLPIQFRYLREFPKISPVEESGKTYEENAILKAAGYSKQTGICALADDSGLEVDALGGLPGVRSARYGGDGASDQERTEKLLMALTDHQAQKRTARFICCMALSGLASKEAPSGHDEPALIHVCESKMRRSNRRDILWKQRIWLRSRIHSDRLQQDVWRVALHRQERHKPSRTSAGRNA
jgi:non-canonical purine NTP pyrophosphatase (RdgB/HAM1 family)